MEFNKLSDKEKQRRKEKKIDEKRAKEVDWHLIFAFKPRRINSTKVVWLERVYRRFIVDRYGDKGYEYKTRGDFMTQALKTGEIK